MRVKERERERERERECENKKNVCKREREILGNPSPVVAQFVSDSQALKAEQHLINDMY